jgi:uncharacterized membrane protein
MKNLVTKENIIVFIGIAMIIYGAYKIATTKTTTEVTTGNIQENKIESGSTTDGLILFGGIAIVAGKIFKLY